jgi:hypothetical protein
VACTPYKAQWRAHLTKVCAGATLVVRVDSLLLRRLLRLLVRLHVQLHSSKTMTAVQDVAHAAYRVCDLTHKKSRAVVQAAGLVDAVLDGSDACFALRAAEHRLVSQPAGKGCCQGV